jgi:hypothetical protein
VTSGGPQVWVVVTPVAVVVVTTWQASRVPVTSHQQPMARAPSTSATASAHRKARVDSTQADSPARTAVFPAPLSELTLLILASPCPKRELLGYEKAARSAPPAL